MEIFLVGGAVRDMLLGLPVQDRDWVVVGGTPDELVARGFLPVGRDFPVFLHPTTQEEYALARTERKTARGYRGFEVHAAPDVTLEQDLARRDLTINSIAACACIDWATHQFGTDFDRDPAHLIDPYGGQRDIQAKVLRHVTDAFREDPVRILRVARFAARFSDFSVAPETMQLMRAMVADGEADALVAERVWQELSRGLMQAAPSRMLEVLQDCGALQALLPDLGLSPSTASILHACAALNAPLAVRFACWMSSCLQRPASDLSPAAPLPDLDFVAVNLRVASSVCERWRVPLDCQELAKLMLREQSNIRRSADFDALQLVDLLTRCDAFRKPQRFADLLLACECDARGHSGGQASASSERARLANVLQAAQSVVTSVVADAAQADGLNGKQIGERIHSARVAAAAAHLV